METSSSRSHIILSWQSCFSTSQNNCSRKTKTKIKKFSKHCFKKFENTLFRKTKILQIKIEYFALSKHSNLIRSKIGIILNCVKRKKFDFSRIKQMPIFQKDLIYKQSKKPFAKLVYKNLLPKGFILFASISTLKT